MTTERHISPLELEVDFGSDIPTERAPEKSAEAARLAVAALGKVAIVEEPWFDSEAPTSVATERPLFPRPPSVPRI